MHQSNNLKVKQIFTKLNDGDIFYLSIIIFIYFNDAKEKNFL